MSSSLCTGSIPTIFIILIILLAIKISFRKSQSNLAKLERNQTLEFEFCHKTNVYWNRKTLLKIVIQLVLEMSKLNELCLLLQLDNHHEQI